MTPFAPEFDPGIAAIRAACTGASLECMRVDDMGEDSTTIQDIFWLIFRGRVDFRPLYPQKRTYWAAATNVC